MADDSLQQRLTELEVRLTFVDDTVNALAGADAELSMRLAALEDIIRGLRSELSSLRASQGADPHSEPPPPHY
ncbi:MAG TPA: SlyX family protein [Dyella sp.]|uniref:SlyX family protein n=1 Tax=Dyella sp. TaxID=1869338 RepID=UPI002D7968B6|nr:SlyX family protein [Dyella sp.]HET6553977.1 SlyX family protein [Dyella sp.]